MLHGFLKQDAWNGQNSFNDKHNIVISIKQYFSCIMLYFYVIGAKNAS